jgi:CHAD domain-containing protein
MNADTIASRVRAFLPAELRGIQQKLKRVGPAKLDESVHDARKSIKKLRATLRLAESMAPVRALNAVSTPLRRAAHTLGPMRDHLVLRETAKRVAGRRETPPPEAAAPPAPPILKRASGDLQKALAALGPLLQEGLDAKGAKKGLRTIYKRAQKEMKRARKTSSDDDLHAWRRRAKDLLYVTELVEAPNGLVKKLRRVTQLLGDDHDLATFIAHHHAHRGSASFGHLLQRARKRRAPLPKKAFRLGSRIFSDAPRDFVRHALK